MTNEQIVANNLMNGDEKKPLKLNLQLFAQDPPASGGEGGESGAGAGGGESGAGGDDGGQNQGEAPGSGGESGAGTNNNGSQKADEGSGSAPAKQRIDMFNPEDKTGEGEGSAGEDKNQEPKPGVPEKYEYQLPEGIQITPELDAQFSKIAKGLGLNQEQANQLIGLHTSILQSQIADHEKQIDTWADECKKRGLAGKTQLADAVRAVDTFGGGEFKDLLVQTGLQNHPAMQHFLQNIGGLLHEDTGTSGEKGHETEDLHAIFFPNSPK